MMSVPVVSERAKEVLAPLVAQSVQFVPFHELRNRAYFAFNVLDVRNGLLDESRSGINRFSTGDIMSVDRVVFRSPLPLDLPPVFKLGESQGEIIVTSQLAQVVAKHQLTGVQFCDPEQDASRVALGRESAVTYPDTPPVDA
jgi:hypothetical protein